MSKAQADGRRTVNGLVLCADDFGMDAAADDGILRLAALKRLNATSCLALGAGLKANATALRTSGLQLGLHLNLTEAIGEGAEAMPVSRLILGAWSRRLSANDVRLRIDAQLDAFEDALGGPPDFVDGHQHVHQFPIVRDALLASLGRRYGRAKPWLRSTRAGCLEGTPSLQQTKARVIEWLGGRHFTRQAAQLGFCMNRRFFGVYDFQGGEEGYWALMSRWLAQAGRGDLIMCHPAARAIPGDVLGMQRVAEFNVLKSDAFADLLYMHGFELHPPRV